MNKTLKVVRFHRKIAYKGTIGRTRERFCLNYIQHKQKWFREIKKGQVKKAASLGKTIYCRKGCYSCCDEPISVSLQEGESIVYYLYQHEEVLHSFLVNFQRWVDAAQKHADILQQMSHIVTQGFADGISKEQMQALVEEQGSRWWQLHIPCPLLTDGACSIYEVRPWVCASVFATERCDPSRSNEITTYRADLPSTIELPFYDERISVHYTGIMPSTIYGLLTGGFRFLSDIPGLESLLKEFSTDPEVRAFVKRAHDFH